MNISRRQFDNISTSKAVEVGSSLGPVTSQTIGFSAGLQTQAWIYSSRAGLKHLAGPVHFMTLLQPWVHLAWRAYIVAFKVNCWVMLLMTFLPQWPA